MFPEKNLRGLKIHSFEMIKFNFISFLFPVTEFHFLGWGSTWFPTVREHSREGSPVALPDPFSYCARGHVFSTTSYSDWRCTGSLSGKRHVEASI